MSSPAIGELEQRRLTVLPSSTVTAPRLFETARILTLAGNEGKSSSPVCSRLSPPGMKGEVLSLHDGLHLDVADVEPILPKAKD